MIVVEYTKETGRITGVITYPFDDYQDRYPDGIYLGNTALINSTILYVKDGVVVDRPEHPLTLEGNLLKGVVNGSEVFIDDQTYIADGTDIELEFGQPGTYKIVVKLFPYVTKEVLYVED